MGCSMCNTSIIIELNTETWYVMSCGSVDVLLHNRFETLHPVDPIFCAATARPFGLLIKLEYVFFLFLCQYTRNIIWCVLNGITNVSLLNVMYIILVGLPLALVPYTATYDVLLDTLLHSRFCEIMGQDLSSYSRLSFPSLTLDPSSTPVDACVCPFTPRLGLCVRYALNEDSCFRKATNCKPNVN